MRYVLLLVLIITNLVAFGQKKIYPEQIAFDYFESKLLKEHFDSEAKFVLNKKIRKCTNGCFPKCENDSLSENYLNVATNNIYPAPTDSFINAQKEYILVRDSICFDNDSNNQFIEKPTFLGKKKTRQVYVYENISVIPNLYLVKISVETEAIETNFFIEVDKNGKVTRWCSGKRI